MSTKLKLIAAAGLIFTQIYFIGSAGGAINRNVTPTDVYYLVKSVDESLMKDNGLSSQFNKQPLSLNVNPRNVYQKIANVIAEFNTLYPKSISTKLVSSKVGKVGNNPLASDVYDLVSMMKDALNKNNSFSTTTDAISPKKPSDVFQLLRQLSAHISEASDKKGLNVNSLWSAGRVYEANYLVFLAGVQKLANDHGVEYSKYNHPVSAESGKKPKDVFSKITSAHNSLSNYYVKITDRSYTPVVLEDIADKQNITPIDVFDLVQIATGELKYIAGKIQLSRTEKFKYSSWVKNTKVLPGHVYVLVSYIESITQTL
ncbi:MAG: hypothetical protein IIB39_08380 [Candidatus Marinimicrobia bacterium]|nr:hypothetical protein [Candidatus Neomarinimicrobiota bacterium]